MEPRIIKGHIFRCKKDVKGCYRKGRIYECEYENVCPELMTSKYACGFITNDTGNTGHTWPYNPKEHPLSNENDRWTDFFDDLGEKPAGMIITPYSVGDTVSWFCFDDYEIHKSKIISMEIEVVKGREPIIVYKTRIKFKGTMQEAGFTMNNIRDAHKK